MIVPLTETTKRSIHGEWLSDRLRMDKTDSRRTDEIKEREAVKLYDCRGNEISVRRKLGFV